MTSLWKVTPTQIASRKLKAGSRCAGHNPGHWHCPSVALLTPSRRRAGGFRSTRRVGVTVTSLSRGLTFHPLGPQWDSGRRVRWLTGRVPGTVRDYGQGPGIRGQLLDWPGQGPVPGPWCITAVEVVVVCWAGRFQWVGGRARHWHLPWSPEEHGPGSRALHLAWGPSRTF